MDVFGSKYHTYRIDDGSGVITIASTIKSVDISSGWGCCCAITAFARRRLWSSSGFILQ